MTTNPVRPGHAPHGFPQGAHTSAGQDSRGIPPQRGSGLHNAFDFVLRGYDRNQVDERIAELLSELAAATERVQTMSAQLADEQRRAGHAERELRAARDATPPAEDTETTQGFGYRAERLLRMAEAEANEIRGAAIKEAAETMERARAAAEAHRHEIEQNLIMRATTLDKKANEVAVALRDREQAAAAELSSARAEAETVRAAARHEMEQARKNVEIVARDVRAQAERWAAQHRAVVSGEVARLVKLRDTMQQELGQLSTSLLAAVRSEQPSGAEPRGAEPRGAEPRKAEPSRPTPGERKPAPSARPTPKPQPGTGQSAT